MKDYKVKKDFTDSLTGALVTAGQTITATDERAEQLRSAGVINVTPVAAEAEAEPAEKPAKK